MAYDLFRLACRIISSKYGRFFARLSVLYTLHHPGRSVLSGVVGGGYAFLMCNNVHPRCTVRRVPVQRRRFGASNVQCAIDPN